DRVDEADDAAGAAHVEPGQRVAARVEVEERVAGEHLPAGGEQPLVGLALLGIGRGQLVPGGGAAAGRARAGGPPRCAVRAGERLEPVELVDVVAGDDDADLERTALGDEVGGGEVVHRPAHRVVAAGTTDGVVGGGVGAVEAELDVEVVHRRQPAGL